MIERIAGREFPDHASSSNVTLMQINDEPVFAPRVQQLIRLSRESHLNSFT